ncbi:26S proteasome non-ATPase regulatory subunit 12/cop9 signalosome complex subunit 4 [Babesia gibsoni]|uniref:26S proteasome non-ATPase regulatory subunit 12/cop9 signalosome complex subunit 4 n=1 Tax=Babesia gibsoni TaxID=33632 RepID=A0AAD8PEU5_BABGI|nr:26S proteasome non-ATPase regulatory subunit 12/cop9 signalosome complex subunit 4 [Babesia gibsoni]
MDNDTTDVVNTDMVFRDEPRLEDLSLLVDDTLGIVDSMLKNNKSRDIEFVKTVLLELMMAEKRCRAARDGQSNARLCKCIIQLLYDIGDLANLNYYLVLLSRKRGQLKATISATVNLAMGWISEIKGMEDKMNLINTLNHITLGKMFLESQRAELAFTLAKIKEAEGKIDEAAKVVHNVEVETFGSLPRPAKVHYILEQMRLHLLNKDYLRFFITSKKIKESLLSGEEYGDSELTFYGYMIQYYLHEGDYFEIAQAYNKRMNAAIRLGKDDWKKEMECMLLFLIISPISDDVNGFRKDIMSKEAKRISEAPLFAHLFTELMSENLLPLPLDAQVSAALRQHTVFSGKELPDGEKRLQLLNDRVVQHDILVASKFYTNIRLRRLAELINTAPENVEVELSAMVNSETIHAKINRPEGLIKFGKRKDPDLILDNWAKGIATLLGQVDQCSRLVQKERMIHEARLQKIELEKALHD